MKLKISLVIALVITSLSALNAQITYGAKGGLQFTNITNYHRNSNTRIGFQIGGFAKIPLDSHDKMYLQPELLYSTQGEDNEGDGFSEKYYINYIALPVLLKRYLSDNENAFFLEVGPTFMFKIMQNTESSFAAPSYNGDRDEVSTFDISLAFGLGYSIGRNYDIGLRYNYGFSDVYPKAVGESSGKVNATSNLQVTLAYTF